ncbi:SIS domain-containing protein [Actinomycetospora chiangmaiensis]|uniref:SIS domain-containing protein n=1 Tax=Actinomycetospora chiangmaiensis TaxID=402650 RepID=UPI000370EE40|nr:SIS domain-containing protein [Actinomycetospora chiangmaiensis]
MESAAVVAAFDRRRSATAALADEAEGVAAACRAMAGRFAAGGRLLTFGNGTAAADAAHLAVEFVHPVIVGKRALPAVSLANDAATLTAALTAGGPHETFATPLRALAASEDIALGLSIHGHCENVAHALEVAHEHGLLTVALAGGDGGLLAGSPDVDHLVLARSSDPAVVREMHVTIYHVLWELVHVFLENPDSLPGRVA